MMLLFLVCLQNNFKEKQQMRQHKSSLNTSTISLVWTIYFASVQQEEENLHADASEQFVFKYISYINHSECLWSASKGDPYRFTFQKTPKVTLLEQGTI